MPEPKPPQLEDISAGNELHSTEPDTQTQKELSQLHVEDLKSQLASREQDRAERKNYASKTYWLMVGWLGGLMVLVSADAGVSSFSIPAEVLVTLVGSTTVGIIGLFRYVAMYLFSRER